MIELKQSNKNLGLDAYEMLQCIKNGEKGFMNEVYGMSFENSMANNNATVVKSQRINEIDYLKTFAILLVVWGHFLECFSSPYSNLIYQLIYMFHMPLFIFNNTEYLLVTIKISSSSILYKPSIYSLFAPNLLSLFS